MNKKTSIIVGIVVVIFFGIIFFYPTRDKKTEKSTINNEVAVEQDAQSVSFGDIIFFIPHNFGLATNSEQILEKSYIPQCSENFNYCLYYTGEEFRGSNFDGAGLRVELKKNFIDKESCLSSQPEGYSGLLPTISDNGTYVTSVLGPLGDAGAGHYSNGEVYRLWTNNRCYEFETRIAESQFANYEKGTIREFTDSDRTAIWTKLYGVLGAVKIKDTSVSIDFPALEN